MPARFTDPAAARKHLEALLWADGRPCPHCGVLDDSTALKGQSTRPGVYWCNSCQKPFSVTVGTVYEGSKIPLNTWLYANHLLCSSKKGISGHQLARMLGVTYKSAWFMGHRIRAAMAPIPGSEPPLGGEGKVVEADEAYIGKKNGPKGRKHRGAGGYGHKRTVLSLVERSGKIRSFKIGGPAGIISPR
jgi:transposase-like protein